MRTYRFTWVLYTLSFVMKWILQDWGNLYFIRKVQSYSTATNAFLPAKCTVTFIITSQHIMQCLKNGMRNRKMCWTQIVNPRRNLSLWNKSLCSLLNHKDLPCRQRHRSLVLLNLLHLKLGYLLRYKSLFQLLPWNNRSLLPLHVQSHRNQFILYHQSLPKLFQ